MKRDLQSQILDLFAGESGRAAPDQAGATPTLTADLPVAKRLNRNALTVAAVIMGMTVIACLVVVRSDSREAPGPTISEPVSTNSVSPSFLDRPVLAPTRQDISGVTPGPAASVPRSEPPRAPVSFATEPPYPSQAGFPMYSQSAPAPIPAATPREKAFDAALRGSAVARDAAISSDATSGASGSGSLAAEETHLVAYGDSVMRNATQSGSALSATGGVALASPRRTFMQQAGDLGGRSVAVRLEPAGSPYVLRAGTVIPGILLTAITSDLPGDCLGQVSRDVYDSQTQRVILIPKGSKLMCRYDDQVAAGQGRLLVAWTRLMLPDGRSMTLPGLALKDPEGQTGAKGDVDNHTRRVFGRALLLSAIGAGAQLSQPRQASILAAPTTGQVMAGAVGQEMSNVALEVLRRGIDQPPTITLPQGQSFNVFLNGDLIFDGPYSQAP